MAKHRSIQPNELSERTRQNLILVAFFTLILSLLAIYITDGSRAYAEAHGNIPSMTTRCEVEVTLPSVVVMKYDNHERPLPNTFRARVKSTPSCAISGQYVVRNEANEVMSVITLKPFAKSAKFVLHPGSGSYFISYPDERTYDAMPKAVVLGSPMPLRVNVSNTMSVFYSRVGANP